MAIKETPVNLKVYYRLFKEDTNSKLKEAKETIETLKEDIKVKHENISSCKEIYRKEFDIDLDNFIEFIKNEYSTGRFLRVSKGVLINKENDYELVSDAFELYDLASKQKELFDTINNVAFYEKLLALSLKDYTEYLRAYYTEVHKQMILEGKGYQFSNGIGWVCIARCILTRPRKKINYAATKRREQELISQGKRIYNKEEADWCARNGIEYKAEDKRVFTNNEYCYYIPLIDSKLPNGSKLKFEIADYRHTSMRGCTNENIIEQCNSDTKKICELPIDLKTKVTLCDKADKILYTKFIRNENQKPFTFVKTDR